MLSQNVAQNVVHEIGNLVNKNINIMDVDGVIIASTDSSRIGQSHWGAEQIISNHLDELYITHEDIKKIDTKDYVQTGLNLPLMLEDKTVGVIGITGKYNDVIEVGQIVRKMAEILLTEQVRKQKILSDQRAYENFISEYLNYRNFNFTQLFIKQAKVFNFDLKKDYIIIFFREDMANAIEDQNVRNQITQKCKLKLRYYLYQGVIVEKNCGWLIIIPRDMTKPPCLKNKFVKLYNVIKNDLCESFKVKFYFGISSLKAKMLSPNDTMEQAKQSLTLAIINQNPLVFYDEIGLENIIFYLPKIIKEEFLNDFFGDLSKEEINEYTTLFESYYRNEGSISEIANELFIHSNTVQYRLNKFTKRNGKDIRKTSQTPIFYMAILLKKERDYIENLSKS